MLEITNRTQSRLPVRRLKAIGEAWLTSRRLLGREVSVALVGDRRIRSLNRDYLGHDQPTDILAFPADSGDPTSLGELVIGWLQVRRQAREYGMLPQAELELVLVHGLLHLVGWDDRTPAERARMNRTAAAFLRNYHKKYS